jgi:acyl-CoA reductase-like NAD-dependent aldehyde dehydrogenase
MALIDGEATSTSNTQPIIIIPGCNLAQAITYTHSTLLPSTTTTRILVHTSLHHLFLESLLDTLEAASQTHLLDIATIPEITESNLQRVRDLATEARNQGAKVVTGGVPPVYGNLGGFFELPTVIDGVRPEMGVFREAVMGPLATVTVFSDEREAIPWVNEILGGAGAVIFAGDVERARRVAGEVQAGPVSVNSEPNGK